MDSENTIADTYNEHNKYDYNPEERNPSLPIIKLYYMCQDLYNKNTYPLFFRQMTNNITRDYSDKFTFLDKIILLILGVEKVNGFKMMKETLDIKRFDPTSLSEEEMTHPELESPVIYMNTTNGNVVIGYDYAYVVKPKLQPSIDEKSDDEKKHAEEQDKVDYDIDYPVVAIDNEKDVITITKHGNDKVFFLEYKTYNFRSVFSSEQVDTTGMEPFDDKHIDELQLLCTDLTYAKCVKNDEMIVYEFTGDDDIIVQHIYYYGNMNNNYDIIYPSNETIRTYFVKRPAED